MVILPGLPLGAWARESVIFLEENLPGWLPLRDILHGA